MNDGTNREEFKDEAASAERIRWHAASEDRETWQQRLNAEILQAFATEEPRDLLACLVDARATLDGWLEELRARVGDDKTVKRETVTLIYPPSVDRREEFRKLIGGALINVASEYLTGPDQLGDVQEPGVESAPANTGLLDLMRAAHTVEVPFKVEIDARIIGENGATISTHQIGELSGNVSADVLDMGANGRGHDANGNPV